MQETNERPDHGAGRVLQHPILPPSAVVALDTFTVDGAPVVGVRGEPLAAAMIAAGIRVFRTMPRFGDPRGGYCMIGRCADCQVIVDGNPGVRACVTPVRAGIDVRIQRGLGENDLIDRDEVAQ